MPSSRDVVFVDGVRTPFGRSGPRACTRRPAPTTWSSASSASSSGVTRSCRPSASTRSPSPPPPRSATRASPSAARPRCWPGCPSPCPATRSTACAPGAMTAVTTVAGGIAFGAYDVAIAGGVEHMGRHPMGEGVDPNPRFLSEKLVDPSALVMGMTAENLHDRYPSITKERADAYAVASQEKVAKAYADGKIQPDLVPTAIRTAEKGWGLATADEAPRPGTTLEDAGRAEDPVPAARQRHRGQRLRHQRRRHRLPRRRRRRGRRAGPDAEDAAGLLRLRGRRPRGHGRRPDPVHRAGAAPGRAVHRRHRPVRDQRGVRRTGAGLPGALRDRRRRPAGQPLRRRDRLRPPAGLLRRAADDAARPPVRRAPRRPLRHHHDVRRAWAWAAPSSGRTWHEARRSRPGGRC